MSTMAVPENLLPTQQQRYTGKNPMLPGLPDTGNMDAQYLAEEAQLRATIAKQYADVLQQLGYIDPTTGAFLPGSVSVEAGRKQSDLTRQSGIAGDQATDERVRGNAFFSGRTAENVERATQPYERQIAQLGVDTPLALAGLYEKAAGLIDQYTLQNNLYLANMAARQAAAIAKNPAGAPKDQQTTAPTNPGGNPITGPPGSGLASTTPGGIIGDPDYPYLGKVPNSEGDTSPNVFTPVIVGSAASAEPKPSAGNIIPTDAAIADAAAAALEPVPQLDPELGPNVNPEAPGQVFTPDTSGAGGGLMPHPNPEAMGQPAPDIVAPGGEPEGPYGTKLETQEPDYSVSQILDTINNAINATPGPADSDIAAGQAAVNKPPVIVPGRGRAL